MSQHFTLNDMKKTLFLPLMLVLQVAFGQWNAIGWNPFTLRSTTGDSTFVLSAPSRVDLQKGTASWVPERQAPYKVFTASLFQTGTDTTVATIFQNTLGGSGSITFTRENPGVYRINKTGAFPEGKTYLPNVIPIIYTSDGNSLTGSVSFILPSVDYVRIYAYDATGLTLEGLTDISFNIEIRVYP